MNVFSYININLNNIVHFRVIMFKNNNNMSHCYVENEALNRFKEGKYHYLISQVQMPDLKPVKSFLKGGGDIFWAYEFKN